MLDASPVIEKGRSWRDLPPSPPSGEPLPPWIRSEPESAPAAPPPSSARRPWRRWLALAGFLAAVVALVAWSPWSDDAGGDAVSVGPAAGSVTTVAPVDPTPRTAPPPSLAPTDEPVADVAEALLPSVVQIERFGGVGSGFVYDEAGLVLTAAHVVGSATAVDVRLADGRTVEGVVVGTAPERDIAVIRLEVGDLVAAPLAVGVPVTVGQLAVAVGSPFGLDQTVTAGVVSAVDRSLSVGGRTLTGLIQTDAPINTGNSGGPLADRFGRVIGVNVAIAGSSGGNDGLGFAVPIDVALTVADELTGGSVRTPAPPEPSPSDELPSQFEDLFRLLPPELRDELDRFFEDFGSPFPLVPTPGDGGN